MLKNYNPELHIQAFQPHELIFLNLDHPDMDVSFCLFVNVFSGEKTTIFCYFHIPGSSRYIIYFGLLVSFFGENKAQINYTQDPEDPGIQDIQTYISGKFIDRIW